MNKGINRVNENKAQNEEFSHFKKVSSIKKYKTINIENGYSKNKYRIKTVFGQSHNQEKFNVYKVWATTEQDALKECFNIINK